MRARVYVCVCVCVLVCMCIFRYACEYVFIEKWKYVNND